MCNRMCVYVRSCVCMLVCVVIKITARENVYVSAHTHTLINSWVSKISTVMLIYPSVCNLY